MRARSNGISWRGKVGRSDAIDEGDSKPVENRKAADRHFCALILHTPGVARAAAD